VYFATLSPSKWESKPQAVENSRGGQIGSETILLVEDEEAVRELAGQDFVGERIFGRSRKKARRKQKPVCREASRANITSVGDGHHHAGDQRPGAGPAGLLVRHPLDA